MSAVRSSREGIRGMLADLKMPGSLEAIDAILSDIDGGRLAATEAISRLLAAQITLRNKLRAAEERVRKLEFGLIDWEVAQASAQRRTSGGRP